MIPHHDAGEGLSCVGKKKASSFDSGDKLCLHCHRVLHKKVPAVCLTQQKISNSHLVQVYMSKQSGMDTQKVLEHQYSTAETLYKTMML
jgi:hypothetical protein